MASLYDYQKSAARTLATALGRHGSALDASDTGVGKTYTAAGLAQSCGKSVAVVCPKSVVTTWRRVLDSFGVDPRFVLNYEKLVTGRCVEGQWVKRGRFDWSLSIPDDSVMIWDEVHRAKNGMTKTAKLLAGADRFLNLMLSATVAESPLDLRVIGARLQLFKKEDFMWWAIDHGCHRDGFSFLEFPDFFDQSTPRARERAVKARLGLQRLHLEIFGEAAGAGVRRDTQVRVLPSSTPGFPMSLATVSPDNFLVIPTHPRGVRIRRSQIPGFPASHVILAPLDLGDQQKAAEEACEVMEGLLADMGYVEDLAFGINPGLSEQQDVELLKVPTIADRARELIEEEKKSVVIFVNYRASVANLRHLLRDYYPAVVQGAQGNPGDTPDEPRDEAILRFQNNNTRLLIANVQAGGTGLSLHDEDGSHPRVSLISPTWDARALKQVLGRIHRNGGTDVTQYLVVAPGTIEERVVARCLEKISQIDLLNDGVGIL